MAKKGGRRGYKACPECGTENPARATNCKKCKHPFEAKAKKAKKARGTLGTDLSTILQRVKVLDEAGGIAKVKAKIEQLDAIEAELNKLGGRDHAQDLIAIAEAIKGMK